MLLKKQRVLAIATETTIGTAPSLSASNAALNAYDVMIQPNIDSEQRPRQGSFGGLKSIPGLRIGTATFRTEVYGDGAGGVPLWASVLLPACGWVDSANTFSPTTEAPGSNVKTITIASYQAGRRKMLTGAMGTFTMTFPSGKPAFIEWTFTGIWNTPTDTAILSPTYPTVIPPRFASSTFTVGGSNPGCIEQITIDAGNNVIARPCPTTASGIESGLVTDRNVVGQMNPESKLVAGDDVYGDFLSSAESVLSIVLADSADTITFAAPKLQYNVPQEGDREGTEIDDIPFQLNPSSGDDELTINFNAT